MSPNLIFYERLAYSSLAVSALAVLLDPAPYIEEPSDYALLAFTFALMAALVWATARRGRKWTGSIFAILVMLGIVSTFGEFWDSAPQWFRELGFTPKIPTTAVQKLLSVVSDLLAVGALYFYFTDPAQDP